MESLTGHVGGTPEACLPYHHVVCFQACSDARLGEEHLLVRMKGFSGSGAHLGIDEGWSPLRSPLVSPAL